MKLSHCGCAEQHLIRLPRPKLVRWFFRSRGLFKCLACDRKMLLPVPGSRGQSR